MDEDQQHPASGESYDSPDLVLAALHDRYLIGNQVEVDKLQLAVEWAIIHPVESIGDAATVEGTEGELPIAGPGAPLVAEFCVADLALSLGISCDAGRTYLGDAVELHYRLKKLWAMVVSGKAPAWKARRIAQATKTLSPECAAYVDRHLAHRAARCSYAQIDRAVDDALRRHDPAEAMKRARQAAEERCFDVDLTQVSFNGTVHIDGELDIADALDLDDAITSGAAQLAALGSEASLDVRRSQAAGALARRELTLEFPADQPAPRRRELMIYLHLSGDLADGATTSGVAGGFAGVENTRSPVTVEQVKAWCAGTNTKVTIRPVIDLNHNLATDAYRPTETMREQAILINATCVYPHCNRPARTADLDHLEAYDPAPGAGGKTESRNLAPLCRGHHRYKTHAGWDVARTGPTSFTWTNQHGYTYDWDTSHTQHTRHTG